MKRTWILAIVLTLALIMTGCCLSHEWVEAGCEEPQTCAKCGKTEGEALGHEWSEADCVDPKTCGSCGKTEGEALGHDWAEATCTEPRTCVVCAQTEGQALGHDWAEADCLNPMTCGTCGATDGEALGHAWVGISCQDMGHCERCGEAGTELGDHIREDWEYTDDELQMMATCTVCGDVVTEEVDELKMASSWICGTWEVLHLSFTEPAPDNSLVTYPDGTFVLVIEGKEYQGTWTFMAPIKKTAFGHDAYFVMEYEGGSFLAKSVSGYFCYVYKDATKTDEAFSFIIDM